MMRSFLFQLVLFSLVGVPAAQALYREKIPLNDQWTYYPAYNVLKDVKKEQVVLPHTWNAKDALESLKYNREAAIYQRKLDIPESMKNKRLFLYFEGVNSVAQVFVNGKTVGDHFGGYTAFCLEITDYVNFGEKNDLEVYVSNAHRLDVAPLSGDFNIYGGLHRPVHLLVTGQNCISPLDYASSGVYIQQKNITENAAEIEVQTMLSLKDKRKNYEIRACVYDQAGQLVKENTKKILDSSQTEAAQKLVIDRPVLWNGKENPYLYTVEVELLNDGVAVDRVAEKTGFRYFSVDHQKGFFLNGKYLDLYGFCKHVDRKGKGSAVSEEDYQEEMALIKESGATSLRLTHYPHGKPVYKLCDENGIIVWTEIPFVGPGGYISSSYMKTADFERNTRNMLLELIKQNFNSPSICFWGIFNEVKMDYDNPVSFVRELHNIAKKEDPSRLTTLATFIDQDYFLGTTDLIAWNKYYGWYGGDFHQIGAFTEDAMKNSNGTPVGISEYGAGGSITQHEWPAQRPVPTSKYHPEEWQALYHEGNWQELSTRPFIWGKYIWVFADFGSSIRTEGDTERINNKGLITYDYKTKKDAFYFYKANWNPEPMIYITSRRFTSRTRPVTDIRVYTNAPEADLYINNKKIGTGKKDKLNRVIWENVTLSPGKNEINVKAKNGLEDSCEWYLN
ncbi:MAG: glycoside hydrolase family 2 protein [Leadbetterella sp.]|nr:glycoside hydrolase family 2 protein [Leadbetterella sp.]